MSKVRELFALNPIANAISVQAADLFYAVKDGEVGSDADSAVTAETMKLYSNLVDGVWSIEPEPLPATVDLALAELDEGDVTDNLDGTYSYPAQVTGPFNAGGADAYFSYLPTKEIQQTGKRLVTLVLPPIEAAAGVADQGVVLGLQEPGVTKTGLVNAFTGVETFDGNFYQFVPNAGAYDLSYVDAFGSAQINLTTGIAVGTVITLRMDFDTNTISLLDGALTELDSRNPTDTWHQNGMAVWQLGYRVFAPSSTPTAYTMTFGLEVEQGEFVGFTVAGIPTIPAELDTVNASGLTSFTETGQSSYDYTLTRQETLDGGAVAIATCTDFTQIGQKWFSFPVKYTSNGETNAAFVSGTAEELASFQPTDITSIAKIALTIFTPSLAAIQVYEYGQVVQTEIIAGAVTEGSKFSLGYDYETGEILYRINDGVVASFNAGAVNSDLRPVILDSRDDYDIIIPYRSSGVIDADRVFYDGTRWIILTNDGGTFGFHESTDYINWTEIGDSNLFTHVTDSPSIEYNGSVYAQIGTNQSAFSADLLTWTQSTNQVGCENGRLYEIGGTFIALKSVSAGADIHHSANGDNWTTVQLDAQLQADTIFFNGLAFDGTTYVVSFVNLTTGTTYIYRSTDLATWVQSFTIASQTEYVLGVVWTGTEFLAIMQNGSTFTTRTSADGITFGGAAQTVGIPQLNGDIAFVTDGAGRVTIWNHGGNPNGSLYTSSDNVNFIEKKSEQTTMSIMPNPLRYDNGLYYGIRFDSTGELFYWNPLTERQFTNSVNFFETGTGDINGFGIDVSQTPPVDVEAGKKYLIEGTAISMGVPLETGDIVLFKSVDEFVVLPKTKVTQTTLGPTIRAQVKERCSAIVFHDVSTGTGFANSATVKDGGAYSYDVWQDVVKQHYDQYGYGPTVYIPRIQTVGQIAPETDIEVQLYSSEIIGYPVNLTSTSNSKNNLIESTERRQTIFDANFTGQITITRAGIPGDGLFLNALNDQCVFENLVFKGLVKFTFPSATSSNHWRALTFRNCVFDTTWEMAQHFIWSSGRTKMVFENCHFTEQVRMTHFNNVSDGNSFWNFINCSGPIPKITHETPNSNTRAYVSIDGHADEIRTSQLTNIRSAYYHIKMNRAITSELVERFSAGSWQQGLESDKPAMEISAPGYTAPDGITIIDAPHSRVILEDVDLESLIVTGVDELVYITGLSEIKTIGGTGQVAIRDIRTPVRPFIDAPIIEDGLTLKPFNHYMNITTVQQKTVALPTTIQFGGKLGTKIIIDDYAQDAATNNITVEGNSQNINGSVLDYIINTNGQVVVFTWVGGSIGWRAGPA